MKNFYQIYIESIKNVSPIQKNNGEYVLMVDLNSRKNNFGITNLSSVNGNYENFEDVYNDFVDNIYSVHKRNSKDSAELELEVYRFMAISILSAQLGLVINYNDNKKFKNLIDDFLMKFWANYQPDFSDNWTNIYPPSFPNKSGRLITPKGKGMSIYIQIGDSDIEKIRISDHAITSMKSSTTLLNIDKDDFEKIVFNKDGNLLAFIDNVKKEYKNFLNKDIAEEENLKVIENIILKRGTDLIAKIESDDFIKENQKEPFKQIIFQIYTRLKKDPLFLRKNILKLKKEMRILLTCFVKGFTVDFINDLYLKNNPVSDKDLYKISISDVNKFNSERGKRATFLDIGSLVGKYIKKGI